MARKTQLSALQMEVVMHAVQRNTQGFLSERDTAELAELFANAEKVVLTLKPSRLDGSR